MLAIIRSVVFASSSFAVHAIIFNVLNRKWGLIWLFSTSSRVASRRFSISIFSSSSLWRSSAISLFSFRVLIYPSVACFILLKALTSSPISSLFSTVMSLPLKSFLAIFLEVWASLTSGSIRALDSSFVMHKATTIMTAENRRIRYGSW